MISFKSHQRKIILAVTGFALGVGSGHLYRYYQSLEQNRQIARVPSSDASVILDNSVDLSVKYRRDISGQTPDRIHEENLSTLSKFRAEDVNRLRDDSYGRAQYLCEADADRILRSAERNPVVSMYYYSKYDPKNEGIGFCFGRAMFIHLELAQFRFDRDSVKKAFVVGPMSTGDGGSWGWHVTTIVKSWDARSKKQIWYALDPVVGRRVTLEQWYNTMRSDFSTDKRLKIYITDPGRFGIYPSKYDETHLANRFYNNYFRDMMKWFESNSQQNRAYDEPLKECGPATPFGARR